MKSMLFYLFYVVEFMNPNSWYIAMHFDRLNQELLDVYGNHVEEKSEKKNKQTKDNTKMKKTSDD